MGIACSWGELLPCSVSCSLPCQATPASSTDEWPAGQTSCRWGLRSTSTRPTMEKFTHGVLVPAIPLKHGVIWAFSTHAIALNPGSSCVLARAISTYLPARRQSRRTARSIQPQVIGLSVTLTRTIAAPIRPCRGHPLRASRRACWQTKLPAGPLQGRVPQQRTTGELAETFFTSGGG